MLHAIEKSKSKSYERYWGVRDHYERGNIMAEDEITSTIFGPMDFMAVEDVWCIAKKLLGDKAPADITLPSEFKLEFWPILESGIEPDATLVFDWEVGGRKIAILFEMKWNASLSGDDQLHKQWHDFSKPHVDNAYHLFIAKRNAVKAVERRFEDQKDENPWGDKLICHTWDDMRAILGKIVEVENHVVYRWAQLADKFLLLATGTRPFGGFGVSEADAPEGFGCYAFPDFSKLTKPLFWDDQWFAQLDKLIPEEPPLHQPSLFFGE